jgi:hypothetical protein
MANPTTNYSFAMPTNTDLVKDLPADFEIFGQAVDTQMKTNADAAIAKTIVDAKGDIIAATAADTVSRLAVGSNDQVLTADSSTATGLKWAAPAAGGMTLLSTTTLSGASTTISSISQDYKRLMIYMYGHTNNTSDGTARILPNNTSGHTYVLITDVATGVYVGGGQLELNYLNNPNTNAVNSYCITYDNYASTTHFKPMQAWGYYDNTNNRRFFIAGAYYSTSAISSLTFTNTGGNWSAGTVQLYGVK